MFDEIIFGGGDEVILANEMVKCGYGFYTDYMNLHPHSDIYKETLSYAPHVINRRNHQGVSAFLSVRVLRFHLEFFVFQLSNS